MHLHEVLKIEISFHAQSCTFIRPRLNSAHIGVACPLFFYTPLTLCHSQHFIIIGTISTWILSNINKISSRIVINSKKKKMDQFNDYVEV